MNQPDPFDRLISDWLQEGAYEAPDEPVQAATRHALRHPRVPDPFAFLRKDAMNPSRSIVGLPALLAAALLLLIVAAIAATAGGLFRPRVAVITGPTPGPSVVARATQTPAPSEVRATQTPAPSRTPASSETPFMRTPELGDAIPDSMLGPWFDTSSTAFPWILRAGNDYCVSVLSTTQDCMAWDLGDGRVTYGAVMTIIGDTVALRYLNGSGCKNAQGKYSWTIDADAFTLTWVGGSCQSGDYHFQRAGTGSAPTAPPMPSP